MGGKLIVCSLHLVKEGKKDEDGGNPGHRSEYLCSSF